MVKIHQHVKFQAIPSMCFLANARKPLGTDGRTDRRTDRRKDGHAVKRSRLVGWTNWPMYRSKEGISGFGRTDGWTDNPKTECLWRLKAEAKKKQGKSERFESCDRPIVPKRPIWVKIGDVLSRVTLKLDGWPWKTIGHLSFAVSSYVQHFIAIGEFKLELQSGNAQFGLNSMIFRAVWPWNLTYDFEKQ